MKRLKRHFEPSALHAAEIAKGLRRRCRKPLRDEVGAALVEVAVSSSLILGLFIAGIQFGYALYAYQFVNGTARELTRYAIVHGSQCSGGMPNCGFTTSSTLQTFARATYTYPGFDMTKLSVTAAWFAPSSYAAPNPSWSACTATGCNVPGNLVKVTVQYPFMLSIPFWQATTLNVTSSSSMVISQ
jgi:Flp pilus assembly protein TadG